MLALIDDVLDLSKIEAGRVELSIESLNLLPLIDDAVNAIRPLAEKNGNRLEDCLGTLRRTKLEAAADELLDRLLAHTGRKLDDDVAVLLFEATSPSARPEDEPPVTPCPTAVP